MWYHYDITFVSRCQEVFPKICSTDGCIANRATDSGHPSLHTMIVYFCTVEDAGPTRENKNFVGTGLPCQSKIVNNCAR